MDTPMIYELCHKDEMGISIVDTFTSMVEAEKMCKVYTMTFGRGFFIR